jgi:hypothetical protein
VTVPLESWAAFGRGGVILKRRGADDDACVAVRGYRGRDGVMGRTMKRGEWRELVATGRAIEFAPHVTAASGLAFWVLGPTFLDLDLAVERLVASGATTCGPIGLATGGYGFLVHEPTAEAIRCAWVEDAARKARHWAACHAWDRATEAASQAFAVDWTMAPANIAMLSFAIGRAGDRTRDVPVHGPQARRRPVGRFHTV